MRKSTTAEWSCSPPNSSVASIYLARQRRPKSAPHRSSWHSTCQAAKRDARALPIKHRRTILDDVAAEVVDTAHLARRLDGDGAKAWATVEEGGYEGMVAKDRRSTYRSGPTQSWVKVKQRREGVFLIGGLATGRDRFGVLVGQRQARALRFLGTVEMGYSRTSVSALMEGAVGLVRASSPFVDSTRRRGVTWVTPTLKAEVTFAEIVAGRLRAAVWRGLRKP